jgi:hypothetical protein
MVYKNQYFNLDGEILCLPSNVHQEENVWTSAMIPNGEWESETQMRLDMLIYYYSEEDPHLNEYLLQFQYKDEDDFLEIYKTYNEERNA